MPATVDMPLVEVLHRLFDGIPDLRPGLGRRGVDRGAARGSWRWGEGWRRAGAGGGGGSAAAATAGGNICSASGSGTGGR